MESVLKFSITGINGGSKFSATLGGLHKSGGSIWSAVKDRGGVPRMTGGGKTNIEELSNIVGSKATEILEKCINEMCVGMLGELGSSSNLSGKSLKEKIDLLLSKLPGPNETINEDMKTVLIAVADQLNRSFQFNINTHNPVDVEVLMYDVVNTLSSLVMGLNTDVATAFNAVKGTATNLVDHAAVLDKLVEYLELTVKNNSDKIKDRVVIDGIIKTIKERSDSISTYAKNLMNGLEPKLNSAATGFKLNNLDKVQQLVARLNGKPYKEMSDVEGYSAEIVKAFGETVYYAYVINDALKKTNMSINDLKRDGLTPSDLTNKLKEIMDKYSKIVLDDPLHAGENEKMIREIMVQIRNGENLKRIVNLIDGMKLDSVSGGNRTKMDNRNNMMEGGADVEYETPVGRRVRKQIRNKVAIMKAFNLVIGKAFDAIVKEIEFAKDLGYSTPITEDLIDFSENMDNLSDFRVPDVYMALIGFDKSSVGESTYNNYMRSIDNVLTSIKKLNNNSTYSSIHMKLSSVADHLEKFKSDVESFRKGMSSVSNTFDGNLEKAGGTNKLKSILADSVFDNLDKDFSELLLYRDMGELPFDDETIKKINFISEDIQYQMSKDSKTLDVDLEKTLQSYNTRNPKGDKVEPFENLSDLPQGMTVELSIQLIMNKLISYLQSFHSEKSLFVNSEKYDARINYSLYSDMKILINLLGSSMVILQDKTQKNTKNVQDIMIPILKKSFKNLNNFWTSVKNKVESKDTDKGSIEFIKAIILIGGNVSYDTIVEYINEAVERLHIRNFSNNMKCNLMKIYLALYIVYAHFMPINNNLSIEVPVIENDFFENLVRDKSISLEWIKKNCKYSIEEEKAEDAFSTKYNEGFYDHEKIINQINVLKNMILKSSNKTFKYKLTSLLAFVELQYNKSKTNDAPLLPLIFKDEIDYSTNESYFSNLHILDFYDSILNITNFNESTLLITDKLLNSSNLFTYPFLVERMYNDNHKTSRILKDVTLNTLIDPNTKNLHFNLLFEINNFKDSSNKELLQLYCNILNVKNKSEGTLDDVLESAVDSNTAKVLTESEISRIPSLNGVNSYDLTKFIVTHFLMYIAIDRRDKLNEMMNRHASYLKRNITLDVKSSDVELIVKNIMDIINEDYKKEIYTDKIKIKGKIGKFNANTNEYEIREEEYEDDVYKSKLSDKSKENISKSVENEGLIERFKGLFTTTGGKSGGADNSFDLLKEALPDNSKYTVKISEKLKSLKYYIRVAAIKENIKNVQGELEKDTAHYDNMTSEMIAEKIKQLDNLREANISNLQNVYGNNPTKIKSMTKFYNDEFQVKRNLLEAAQALDSQLKLVTENIVKNPETIQEIKNMITDSDIISYWYDESSGNKLCELFEQFNVNSTPLSIGPTEHYYQSLYFTGKVSLLQILSSHTIETPNILNAQFYKEIYHVFMSLTKNFIIDDNFGPIRNIQINQSTIPNLLYRMIYNQAVYDKMVPIDMYELSNDPVLRTLALGFSVRRDFGNGTNYNPGAGPFDDAFLLNRDYGNVNNQFYMIKYENYANFKFCNMFKYPIIPAICLTMGQLNVADNLSDPQMLKLFLAGFSIFLSVLIMFPDKHDNAAQLPDSIRSFIFTDGANAAQSFHNTIHDFLDLMLSPQQPVRGQIVIPATFTQMFGNILNNINAGGAANFSYDSLYEFVAVEMKKMVDNNISSCENIIKDFYVKMVDAISNFMEYAANTYTVNYQNLANVNRQTHYPLSLILPKFNTPIVNSIPIIAYEAIKNCNLWVGLNDNNSSLQINNMLINGAPIGPFPFNFVGDGMKYVRRINNIYLNSINDNNLSNIRNGNAPNSNSIKFFNKMKVTAGNFVDPLSVDSYQDLLKSVKGVFSSQAMLKNIIEIFLKIGGYKETSNSMHPKLLYSRLLDYCIRSSIDLLNSKKLVQGQNLRNQQLINNAVGAQVNYNGISYPSINPEGIILTTSGRFSRYNRFNDTFEGEDEIFELMMKSIVAKIFTILGVSDLFERPVGTTKPTALRLLIGGNDGVSETTEYASGSINGGNEIPEVYDDIADLYVKLLLYLEFYKDIFRPENIQNGQIEISMIPDINNMFTKVIDIVFNKNNGNETGFYSIEDVKEFVRSVNMIYEKNKDPSKNAEQITKLIISNLVNEVNRRYGILTDTDAKAYSDDKYLLYQMSDPSGVNKTRGYDSALLPDEDLDESQIGFNAPSNKYLPDNLKDLNKTVYKLNEVRLDNQLLPNSRRYLPGTWRDRVAALERFRNYLSNYFTNSGYNLNDDIDISDKVRSLSHIKRDLANAKTPQDRFNVIAQTMLGDDFTTTSNQIRYIMFHEMVVTNLTTLKKIYSILAGFRLSLHKLRNLENDIAAFRTNLTNFVANPYINNININDVYDNISANFLYLSNNNYHNSQMINGGPNQFANSSVYLPNASFFANTQRQNINIDYVMQRMPNYSDNFVKLVNYCSLLSCEFQGIVKCQVSNARINIGFGTLTEKIIDLFADTKRNMDMFSGLISKNILSTYEDRKRPGSLYWLNTHLIDNMIKGVEYNANAPGNRSITLNQMSSMVSNISKVLIGELRNNVRNNLGDALVKLTYFTPIRNNVNNNFYLNDFTPESSILKPTMSSINYSTNNRVSVLYSFNDGVNNPVINSLNESVSNKSLVCHFNDTLAKLLKVNTDNTNYKIYKPLINDLINSTFSEQILGTKRLCDGLFDIQGYMLTEINKVKVTGSRDNGIDIFKTICQSIGVDGINFIPEPIHVELGARWRTLTGNLLNPALFPPGAGFPAAIAAPGRAVGVNFIPIGGPAGGIPISPGGVGAVAPIIINNNANDITLTPNGVFLLNLSSKIDGIINSYMYSIDGKLYTEDTLQNIWKKTITEVERSIATIRAVGAAPIPANANVVNSDGLLVNSIILRERILNSLTFIDRLSATNYNTQFTNLQSYQNDSFQTALYGNPGVLGLGGVALGQVVADRNAFILILFNALQSIFDDDPHLSDIRNRYNPAMVFNYAANPYNMGLINCLLTEFGRANRYMGLLAAAAAPIGWQQIFSLIEILSTLFYLSPYLANFCYFIISLFPDYANSAFGHIVHKGLEVDNSLKIGTKIYTQLSGSLAPAPVLNGGDFNIAISNSISILIGIKIALVLKCKLPFDYNGYPRSLHEFIGNFINGEDVIRGFFTLRNIGNAQVNIFDSFNETSLFIATMEHFAANLETLSSSDPSSILSYTASEYKRSIVALKVQFRYELIKHIQNDSIAAFVFGVAENNYKNIKQDKLLKFQKNAKSIASTINSDLTMELTLPSEGCGLFLSLSEILKQYVSERDFKDQTKYRHMADSLSELTASIQEKMSISLPYFEKLFSQLVKRAELIKNIANIGGLQIITALPRNIEEELNFNGKTYIKTVPLSGMPYKSPIFNTGGDINVKNIIIGACDDVINGSVEMIKNINSVIGELSIKPEFFEIKNGFVGNYQNINNKLPFMPLSQLTHSLKPVFIDLLASTNNVNSNLMIPVSDTDTNNYKFLHGSRYLMTKYNIPFTLDKMQSVRDLFSKLISNSSMMVTEESYKKSLELSLSLLRFASDINNYGLLSYSSFFEEINYIDLYINQQSDNKLDVVNTYQSMDDFSKYGLQMNSFKTKIENDIGRDQLRNVTTYLVANSYNLPAPLNPTMNVNTEAVINVTNNNNQSTEFDNIKSVVTNVVSQDHNRKWLIVQNILEVNIIPINIHMLQRDIPLIYLLNYAHTFDHMVQEFTRNYEPTKTMDVTAIQIRSDQIYTRLLLNPYGFMEFHVYNRSYSALVRGQTSIGFGRLKFIGDQLFNKCLLNTLYYRDPTDEYDIPAQRDEGQANDPARPLSIRQTLDYTNLYYPDPANPGTWKSINVSRYIVFIGYQRFHSKIVRHLQFLTLLQHLILHKLGKELEDHDDIVIKSYPIVDPTITQFRGQEMWTEDTHRMSSYDRRPNRRVVPFSVINP
jgi:hypothetical protein